MAPRRRGLSKSVNSDEQAAFCSLLITARKNAKLTQHEVAERLHKPQSFVAKYEGGERRLDVIEFLEISRVLGTDPVHLLKRLVKLLRGA